MLVQYLVMSYGTPEKFIRFGREVQVEPTEARVEAAHQQVVACSSHIV